MKRHVCSYIYVIVLLMTWTSCKQKNEPGPTTEQASASIYDRYEMDAYELFAPRGEASGVLVLFGGFPQTPRDIKREFEIDSLAMVQEVAAVHMRYNGKLWLEPSDLSVLDSVMQAIFQEHKLNADRIYLGGFSSGGNVALLLADHLIAQDSPIMPAGVFVVDSPVDLAALYETSQANVDRDFNRGSVQESRRLIKLIETSFSDIGIDKGIKKYSPYLAGESYLDNLSNLKEVKIRAYTEPDTAWWTTYRQNAYQETNAYSLRQMISTMKAGGYARAELIETRDRGYRSNGFRHPHSWSIVDKSELFAWMLD